MRRIWPGRSAYTLACPSAFLKNRSLLLSYDENDLAGEHASVSKPIRSRCLTPKQFLLILGFYLVEFIVTARFTHASCNLENECIQPNRRGRLCFHPNPNTRSTLPCTSSTLNLILNIHIAAGASSSDIQSIAYYDLSTHNTLGDANYSVSPRISSNNESNIAVCTTGIIDYSNFQTVCRYALSDNDFALAALSKVETCRPLHGFDARVVDEGCCGPSRSICPAKIGVSQGQGVAVVVVYVVL